MLNENDFLKRRIEAAAFSCWLLKREHEKNPDGNLSRYLAEEYKKFYERLLDDCSEDIILPSSESLSTELSEN